MRRIPRSKREANEREKKTEDIGYWSEYYAAEAEALNKHGPFWDAKEKQRITEITEYSLYRAVEENE